MSDLNNACRERLCWFCEHFDLWEGVEGYSELTPGYDASINCLKGHYKNKEISRENICRAETCKDFTWAPTILELIKN